MTPASSSAVQQTETCNMSCLFYVSVVVVIAFVVLTTCTVWFVVLLLLLLPVPPPPITMSSTRWRLRCSRRRTWQP
jgi:hypothetical protein